MQVFNILNAEKVTAYQDMERDIITQRLLQIFQFAINAIQLVKLVQVYKLFLYIL